MQISRVCQSPEALKRLSHPVLEDLEPACNPWSSKEWVIFASAWGREWAAHTGSENDLAGRVLASPICWPR